MLGLVNIIFCTWYDVAFVGEVVSGCDITDWRHVTFDIM